MSIVNKYIIVPIIEVTQEILDKVVETSIDTTRKSLDGTKIIFKYSVDALEEEMTLPYKTYSHSEILDILLTSEWCSVTCSTSSSTSSSTSILG